MTLFELAANAGVDNVSIVGMAKNVGKTVTLNYLINEGIKKGIVLGLTSIGRDGEREDVVFKTNKPPIWVCESTIVATAWDCITRGSAKLEILDKTPYSTPLGEIIIGKVREAGNIELVGPRMNIQLKKLIKQLKDMGSKLVLVDGAVDRVASAAPALTDATILSTGAVLGHSIEAVIEKTALQVEFFKLNQTREEFKKAAKPIIDNGKIGIIRGGKAYELPLKTALMAGKKISENVDDKTQAIVIGGAVSNKIIEDLVKTIPVEGVEIIIKDGTRLFLEPMTYKRFKAKKGKITVVYTINLLGVTVNPISPKGYNFNPHDFLNKIKKALSPIPVFDVVLGEGGIQKGDEVGIY